MSCARTITSSCGSITATSAALRIPGDAAPRTRRTSRVVSPIDRVQPPGLRDERLAVLDAQDERPVALDRVDRPPGRPADGDDVAGPEILPLGEHALRARCLDDAEQPVEHVHAVEPSPPVPHLHEPRPDLLRPRTDGDRARRAMARPGDELVPRHGPGDLLVGRAPPAHPRPDEGRPARDRGGGYGDQDPGAPQRRTCAHVPSVSPPRAEAPAPRGRRRAGGRARSPPLRAIARCSGVRGRVYHPPAVSFVPCLRCPPGPSRPARSPRSSRPHCKRAATRRARYARSTLCRRRRSHSQI